MGAGIRVGAGRREGVTRAVGYEHSVPRKSGDQRGGADPNGAARSRDRHRHQFDPHGDCGNRLGRRRAARSKRCRRRSTWEKTRSPRARSKKRPSRSASRCSRAIGSGCGNTKLTRDDQIRVVATSAVREATNRLAFIDRVYIATGSSGRADRRSRGQPDHVPGGRSISECRTLAGGGPYDRRRSRRRQHRGLDRPQRRRHLFAHLPFGIAPTAADLRIVRRTGRQGPVDHAESDPADGRRSRRPAPDGRRSGA